MIDFKYLMFFECPLLICGSINRLL